MVTGRSANATLIRASCCTQAGYSAALRPAQIGSPITRVDWAGCSSTNAHRSRGMIRPGLRPASVMSTNHFGDHAGIGSDYHAGTTWAPVGQTPVVSDDVVSDDEVTATGARHSLNMISAVTAQGLLRFSTYTGSLTGHRQSHRRPVHRV